MEELLGPASPKADFFYFAKISGGENEKKK
jgi:hypothetical protein